MAYCKNCGSPMTDDAPFCANCGAPAGAGPIPAYTQAYVDPSDHTADFDPADISANKVYALAAYLLGIPGIILALLAARDSKYASFHSRQALQLEIVKALVIIASALLCWTVIVPFAGAVCCLVLMVIHLVCFVQVCGGKAKDAPLVSSLPFLK